MEYNKLPSRHSTPMEDVLRTKQGTTQSRINVENQIEMMAEAVMVESCHEPNRNTRDDATGFVECTVADQFIVQK